MENKKEILGQYFTKEGVINKLLDLLQSQIEHNNNIKILEPSFGTGNFIKVLNQKGFYNFVFFSIL
jgi:hypothetical protein